MSDLSNTAARIASAATLTNALAYPQQNDSAGAARNYVKVTDVVPGSLDAQQVTPWLQVAGATFGTANIQPQISLDGVNWVNHGTAISANGLAALNAMPRSALLRFLIGGTGNITGATVTLG